MGLSSIKMPKEFWPEFDKRMTGKRSDEFRYYDSKTGRAYLWKLIKSGTYKVRKVRDYLGKNFVDETKVKWDND